MAETDSEKKLEFWLLEIAELENYYNPKHQIIRVKYGSDFFDLKCSPGFTVPNRRDHLVIAMLEEKFFQTYSIVTEEQLNFPPGLKDKQGRIKEIPMGVCFLTPKRQTLSTTNPQNAHAGFTISSTNMFDLDNVTVAVTPPLPGKDYTTLEDSFSGDINNESVGFFINKQGTILIKSTGASLTLGREGIHIGGRLASESSIKDTGVMSDNPLARLVPSTIPTAGVSIPKLPNMGTISSIANAGAKFIEITDKVSQISSIV